MYHHYPLTLFIFTFFAMTMVFMICYHTIVRVPSLPSDPIHFHVFCCDYDIYEMLPYYCKDTITTLWPYSFSRILLWLCYSLMIMVLPYHTIVWVSSWVSYHTIVWVSSLPSDPIHFNVFCYDYDTNDYDILPFYSKGTMTTILPYYCKGT